MNRALLILAGVVPLCSCGVYQAVTDDSDDHLAALALITPITAVTGLWPDTRDKNITPLSADEGLIRARDEGEMTPQRAKEILTAMDRCFGDTNIKKMSWPKAESLFGPPDEVKHQSGWTILVYRIQQGKFGERWLTLG